MAGNVQVRNVKIILSSGYEMDILTTKTSIKDILEENHIVLLEDEKVTPDTSEELSDNNTITISKESEELVDDEEAEVIERSSEITAEEILDSYSEIVEKIVVEKEKIPYETVKKNVANGAKSTKNKVVQEGKNGIKEVTYKVKYQNNVEIERKKISEKVKKEPVDKIIQIQEKITTTSRSSTLPRTTYSKSLGSSVKIYKITAYCSCAKCCGKSTGRTASGKKATAGRTVAAPSSFAFGTKLSINGKEYVVEDRGGAISGNRLDIYVSSHSAALRWGVKYLPVEVVD